MTVGTGRKLHPMIEQLGSAVVAVIDADSAWAADLGNAELKAAYKAARAAYKTLADKAENMGVADECSRCGGEGGWKGWPGYTCFKCHGDGLQPYRRAKFQAMPPTRAKKAAEHAAKMSVEREAADANYAAFKVEHPAEAALLDTFKTYDELDETFDHDDNGEFDHFFSGLKAKAKKYGSLSEKQLACVTREIEKRAEAADAAEFPTGTVTVEGEIVGLPESRGYAGGTKLNMLVKLTGEHRGNKIMGTVPAKVYDACHDAENMRSASLIGTRLRFTAEIKRGNEDHFGFFKSPKGVEVTHVEWKD